LCICPAVLLLLLVSFQAATTTEIYTLSLHDALPISVRLQGSVFGYNQSAMSLGNVSGAMTGGLIAASFGIPMMFYMVGGILFVQDRKSTRLNSSHVKISYAVFCLKKKTEIAAHRRHS